MDLTEDKFKLALATDLIIYMLLTWTHGSNNQVSIVNDIMNKWSERVENSATHMKKQIASQMADDNEEMTKDVAMILLDVNNIENKMMKGDFKSKMREAIFRGLAVKQDK